MSKHNYSQYSNKKKQNETEVETPLIPAEETVIVNDVPEINVVTETVDTVTLPSVVDGVVVNCARLNVRAEPSLSAEVICVLDVKSEIKVDTDKHTPEWFYVYTATGAEGYCMKKFVEARL